MKRKIKELCDTVLYAELLAVAMLLMLLVYKMLEGPFGFQ